MGAARNPDEWSRVKELFASALERKTEERAAFLRHACGADVALLEEVQSLLSARAETGSLLASVPETLAQPMIGRRLGAYQIICEIGRGGMAIVYLAARADDEYRKRVAIKLLAHGLAGKEMQRRFRNERQTLAALDHPNIVRLLDGGTTEEGLPYLVMDHVEGVPIESYCDRHRLSTTERLHLFRTVCAAVHYAHQNLVIHRDLKPANILVTAQGVPKLLDFGIAKLLNPELASQTIFVTQANMRAMTPEYASPEQVRGDPVTPATDIYSLGVILYQLTTGHLPYCLKRHTPAEMERVICDSEPERPSTAVTRSEEKITPDGTTQTVLTPEQVSRVREGGPHKLRRRLSGDLDNIILMALRKEPQRRYASVEQFSEDIRRHLEGLPVIARPPTFPYRSSKFVRRHLGGVMPATLLALALLVGILGYFLHQRVRMAESNIATSTHTRRSVALLGFKNVSGHSEKNWLSTALSEMLATELEAGEELRLIPGENVARMKIDLSLSNTDSLAKDTLARVHNNVGADLVVLGSFVDVGNEPNGQLRLDLRVQDAVSGETMASLSQTGTEGELFEIVDRVGSELRSKLETGELSPEQAAGIKASLPSNLEAARLYSEGVERLRLFDALRGRDLLENAVQADPKNAMAHSALAAAWSILGYDAKSREQAKKALELSSNLPRESRLLIEGSYRQYSREWDKAVEIFKTLFTFFPDNLEYGLLLAKAQTDAGKATDASATVTMLRQFGSPAGEDPRIDLAGAYAAEFVGDFKEELAEATEAIIRGRSQHADSIVARGRLYEGWAERNLGEHQKARAAFQDAAQIYETTGDRNGMARALHSIALTYLDEADVAEAMQMYRRSLVMSRELGNKGAVSASLNNIGLVLWQQGDLAEARRTFEELVLLNREIANPAGVALAQYNLGLVLSDEGEIKPAMELENEALATFQRLGQKSRALMVKNHLALLLVTRGELELAGKQIEEVIAARKQLGEKGALAISQLVLGRLYMEEGHWQDLQTLARQAADEFRTENHPEFEAYALVLLTRALLEQGNLAESEKISSELNQLVQKVPDQRGRFSAAVQSALLMGRSGRYAEAIRSLQATIADTRKTGFLGYQLEARLALAQMEMRSGNTASGLALLQSLETDATRHGFALIAQKAAAGKRVRN